MDNMNEIKSIIQNSGNSFHCKVLKYLKRKGWYTLISPYYTDNITDKPREIDIIAEKEFPYNNQFGHIQGTINIKLYIECKYIPYNVVFWFDKKDIHKANNWVLRNTPHKEDTSFKENHHYLNKNLIVAKLFAGSSGRKLENETIYQALNQCLNAMVYNRRQSSIIPTEDKNILSTVEYPIIICNSFNKFYRIEIEDNDNPHKIDDNFQLEVNYAYLDVNRKNKNEYFLIDVVDYNQLDKFLSIVDEDIESIRKIMWHHLRKT